MALESVLDLTAKVGPDGELEWDVPAGMSYRVLVLPDRRCMPVEVLQKVKELVESVATVVGLRPEQAPGLSVSGRQPELWDPISGAMRNAAAFSQAGGRTTVPLELGPYRIDLRDLPQTDPAGPAGNCVQ